MNLSINMIMKIAIVLIAILSIAAIVNSVISDGGDILGSQSDDTRSELDCVMRNKDDTSECKPENSANPIENTQVKQLEF